MRSIEIKIIRDFYFLATIRHSVFSNNGDTIEMLVLWICISILTHIDKFLKGKSS